MAGYIGNRTVPTVTSGAEHKTVFTALEDQTVFTTAYNPNAVHVYRNGVRLTDVTDFTATDGTTITLTDACRADDDIVVIYYAGYTVANSYLKTEVPNLNLLDVDNDNNLSLYRGYFMGGDGSNTTNGGKVLVPYYAADDMSNTLGTQYSNARWAIGYGVEPEVNQVGYKSSADNVAWVRSVLEVGDSMIYKNAGALTKAKGTHVSELDLDGAVRFSVDRNGYVRMPSQPASKAKFTTGDASTSTDPITSSSRIIRPTNVIHNIGGCYNPSTGYFTAPVAGRYKVSFGNNMQVASASSWLAFYVKVNGATITTHYENILPITWQYYGFTEDVVVQEGDTISVVGDVNGGSGYCDISLYGHLSFELVG